MRFHVATSDEQPSVTSRREIFMSRRQNVGSLSRRDVVPHVATSFGNALCHVATWDFTSQRGLKCSLSRRDVAPHVATWAKMLSVTSRCGPARRDVRLVLNQE